MKKKSSVLLIILILMPGVLACSAITKLSETPSLSPTATPQPMILFEESEFNTPGYFYADSTKEVNFSAEDGAFHIELLVPEWYALSPCMDADILFTDFAVEVDATQIDGVDKNLYGLMLRSLGYERNYYFFAISGEGEYTLVYDHLDEDVPTTKIIDWTPSKAINLGQATNHSIAVLIGDTIELYVNNTLLETVQDEHLTAGSVGFVVSSGTTGGVHVSFERLIVTEP